MILFCGGTIARFQWRLVLWTRTSTNAASIYLEVAKKDRERVKHWDKVNKKWFIPGNLNPSIKLFNWKRQYLIVPNDEVGEAKSRGAIWDMVRRQWYISGKVDENKFRQWVIPAENDIIPTGRNYLDVPSRDYKEVAKLGAQWDIMMGKWYVQNDVEKQQFQKWLQDSISANLPNPLARLDEEIASDNAPDRSSFVAVFDIETTGLPEKGKGTSFTKLPDHKDLAMYDSCRIVQMSCMLCERRTLEPIDSCDIIVKSDGFPIDNSSFHGVSLERSLQEGKPFAAAVDQLMSFFNRASILIAHNATFDVTVLKSELHRYDLLREKQALDQLQIYCSMLHSKNIVNSVSPSGRSKYPSLKELYGYAVGKEITNQHDAMHDVENLREALSVLIQKGSIQI